MPLNYDRADRLADMLAKGGHEAETARSIIEKYNESEERDDHGRFAGGGGEHDSIEHANTGIQHTESASDRNDTLSQAAEKSRDILGMPHSIEGLANAHIAAADAFDKAGLTDVAGAHRDAAAAASSLLEMSINADLGMKVSEGQVANAVSDALGASSDAINRTRSSLEY